MHEGNNVRVGWQPGRRGGRQAVPRRIPVRPPGDFTREKLRPRPQNRVLALQDLMRSLVYDAREKNFSLTRNIPQRDDPALVPGEFDNSQRIGKGCDVADDAYGTGGVAWI